MLVNSTYGTEKLNGFKILEAALNLKEITVKRKETDADGKERDVTNMNATVLAREKEEAIKKAFKEWLFEKSDRRNHIETLYNEIFNSTRLREYDGSHIDFDGINPEIKLRQHQINAVARILYKGNTLLAHEVGAGKTYEIIAAAMELKRLGLSNKSLITVPNHMIEQWAKDFMKLYPYANVLAVTKEDFTAKNRKKFVSKIATGDYDAIIISHSQFEKIPMSKECQTAFIKGQIKDTEISIKLLKQSRGEYHSVKEEEKQKLKLEAALTKLLAEDAKGHLPFGREINEKRALSYPKGRGLDGCYSKNAKRRACDCVFLIVDDVINFEELGVDRLFADEAHTYKNLYLTSKMRGVPGINDTAAQKSSDMFMKTRYLDSATGYKGVIFATGTPTSNSMTEMYTMMRYLQYDALERCNLQSFDAWASAFGEKETKLELSTTQDYQIKTRFAKFNNIPELMKLFNEAADIKTAEELNLPRPEAEFHVIKAEPTDMQKEMVAELSKRATAVHNREVDSSTDNMLTITTDGRKLGLDQRLINPALPDDPKSKVNMCMRNIYDIWKRTEADKLTQIVFCDIGTPGGKNKKAAGLSERRANKAAGGKESGLTGGLERTNKFNIYNDIKKKLIDKGVPKSQIAFIQEAKNDKQKEKMFEKVRSGEIRVFFGSTETCGSGTNIQDRLIALHDLDCPWRPADLEQRAGRIIRQGNNNEKVHIYRYVTENTFDSYLFQTLENKQRFISQIMTSKNPSRSMEDVDDKSLSFAEIKGLCAGNPKIKEKIELENDISKLKLSERAYSNTRHQLENKLLTTIPKTIWEQRINIENYAKDIEKLKNIKAPDEGFISPFTVNGKTYNTRGEAGAALLTAQNSIDKLSNVKIGEYKGFDVYLTFNAFDKAFDKAFEASLKGSGFYSLTLGDNPAGNITRIDNVLNSIEKRREAAENNISELIKTSEQIKTELTKTWDKKDELDEKQKRLEMLSAELTNEPDYKNTLRDKTPNEYMAEAEAKMRENAAKADDVKKSRAGQGRGQAYE